MNFSLLMLNKDYFVSKIRISVNKVNYTVYSEVIYNIGNFFLLVNQIGFYYNSDLKILDLLDVITDRLELSYEEYNLTEDSIVYIQITIPCGMPSGILKGIPCNKRDSKLDKKLLSEYSLSPDNNVSK